MLASLSSIHLEPWFAPSWESPNDSNKLKIALGAVLAKHPLTLANNIAGDHVVIDEAA